MDELSSCAYAGDIATGRDALTLDRLKDRTRSTGEKCTADRAQWQSAPWPGSIGGQDLSIQGWGAERIDSSVEVASDSSR